MLSVRGSGQRISFLENKLNFDPRHHLVMSAITWAQTRLVWSALRLPSECLVPIGSATFNALFNLVTRVGLP